MFQVIIRILANFESVGGKDGPVIRGGSDTVTTGALGALFEFEEAAGRNACKRRAKLFGWTNEHEHRDDKHADLYY